MIIQMRPKFAYMVKILKIKNTIPPDQYLRLRKYMAVAKPKTMLSIPVTQMNCFVKARASHT